jgi:hypothetical protein
LWGARGLLGKEKVWTATLMKKDSTHSISGTYAYELTGDKWFLEHARAMYAQTILEKSVNAINNCYWNTQTLLYYLKRFGLAVEGHYCSQTCQSLVRHPEFWQIRLLLANSATK